MGTIENKAVSVVVPVHNEEKTLDQCLISVRRQRVGEVIIVLDRCEDDSEKIAKNHARVDSRIRIFYLKKHKFSTNYYAETLNFGISKAKNDVICITDADTILDRGYVSLLLPYLERPVVSISGKLVPIHKRPLHFFETALGTGRLFFIQIWKKAGGFQDIIACDTFFDLEILKRRLEIRRIEKAVMYDIREYSMTQLITRAIRRGKARRQISQSLFFMLGHGLYCLTKTPFGVIELLANIAGYLTTNRKVTGDKMKQYEARRINEIFQKMKCSEGCTLSLQSK